MRTVAHTPGRGVCATGVVQSQPVLVDFDAFAGVGLGCVAIISVKSRTVDAGHGGAV